MAFTDIAGGQVDVGQANIVTEDDLIKFRQLTAWKFEAMGIPRKVTAQFFGLTRMSVWRQLSDVPEEHRRHLADVSLRTFFDSFRYGNGIGFDSVFQKPQCYKKMDKFKNLVPDPCSHKIKTGNNIRYRSSDEGREVWRTDAPWGGISRHAVVQRVRVSGDALKASPHRAYGGRIVFRMVEPKGGYRELDVQGMRRHAIVRLRYRGLPWRSIAKCVGMHHTTCMRTFDRMSETARTRLNNSELDSVFHVNAKGEQTCLVRRNRQQMRLREKTPGSIPWWHRSTIE
jgi:hypothetical protein